MAGPRFSGSLVALITPFKAGQPDDGLFSCLAIMASRFESDDALDTVLDLAHSLAPGETRALAVWHLRSFKQAKAVRALRGNSQKLARQIGLLQDFSGLVGNPVLRELCDRVWIRPHVVEDAGQQQVVERGRIGDADDARPAATVDHRSGERRAAQLVEGRREVGDRVLRDVPAATAAAQPRQEAADRRPGGREVEPRQLPRSARRIDMASLSSKQEG